MPTIPTQLVEAAAIEDDVANIDCL
jgi:hypothetical protein